MSKNLTQIQDEIRKLQLKLQENNQSRVVTASEKAKTDEIIESIDNAKVDIEEFDEGLVKKVIEAIKIENENQIEVKFYGGLTIEEGLKEKGELREWKKIGVR